MRETAKLSLMLAAICAICGAMLVFVDKRTAGARAAAEDRKVEAAIGMLFGSGKYANASVENQSGGVFVLRGGGESRSFLGAAIECSSAHGYGGNIKLLAAFDAEGTLLDFIVLEAHETPGLGAKISSLAFRAGFKGLRAEDEIRLRKDGGTVDAVTSATISSRAAVEAISEASARFLEVRAGALASQRQEGQDL